MSDKPVDDKFMATDDDIRIVQVLPEGQMIPIENETPKKGGTK